MRSPEWTDPDLNGSVEPASDSLSPAPAFTCWQPNGSGSGRMLDMAINAFWFETRDAERGRVAVVLGGIPGAYLEENGVTELRNLHLPDGGALTLVARSEPDATFRLTLRFHGPARTERMLRFPDFYKVEAEDAHVRPLGQNHFLQPAADATAFRLCQKEGV